MHRRTRLAIASCCLAAALILAGCSAPAPATQRPAAHPAATRRVSRSASAGPTPGPTAAICARNAPGFPCVMRDRIHDVRRYLTRLPGSIGVVLDDRATGAIWRNGNACTEYPAASTIKLAMMTDLLLRNRSRRIHLTRADWSAMCQALYTSNDDDARALWDRCEDAGFAGPHQQYTPAIMLNLQGYDESGSSGFRFGTNKLTQIAAMLFQGHHTPSPHPLPSAVP